MDYGSRPRRGERAFKTPAGGRAVRRVLTGRIVQCTLSRRDGSRFARLHIDADQHVLGVAFYRPSGALLSAVDSSYAAASQAPANVKCGSSAQANDRHSLLEEDEEVVDRRDTERTQPRTDRQGGQERAERMDERHQLVRHQGPGGTTRVLPGKDVEQGGYARRQERRRLGQPERSGLRRRGRVHLHVVRREGHPDRVGHQVQHRVQVVDDRRGGHVGHPVVRGARDRSRSPVRPRHERVEGRRDERDVAVLCEG